MFVDAPGNDAFTTLLLHFDAPQGSTSFKDYSASNHTITPSGSVIVDTSQSVFGGSSCFFNGVDSFLLLDGSADFAFGTGDFAIDFRLRPNSIGTIQTLYDSRVADGAFPDIYLAADGTVRYFVNGADQIIGGAISAGAWFHVAVARAGGNTRLFLNGAQTGATYVDGNNYGNAASRPVVGAIGQLSPPFAFFFNGWIDELRVSKGTARGFTTAFTPNPCSYG